jgi:hypothetical protein
MRTTCHNPCKPTVYPVNPRTYGEAMPNITPIDKPILTELGKKLAGF